MNSLEDQFIYWKYIKQIVKTQRLLVWIQFIWTNLDDIYYYIHVFFSDFCPVLLKCAYEISSVFAKTDVSNVKLSFNK